MQKFTLKQAKNSDNFLRELLSKRHMDYEQCIPFFNSEDEMCVITEDLEVKSFVKRIAATYGKPFLYLQANEGIQTFLESGGFTKAFTDYEDKRIEQTEREKLELRKTQVDLNLAEKTLKEFPRTKWFARIGFLIAIILLIKEIIEFVIRLK